MPTSSSRRAALPFMDWLRADPLPFRVLLILAAGVMGECALGAGPILRGDYGTLMALSLCVPAICAVAGLSIFMAWRAEGRAVDRGVAMAPAEALARPALEAAAADSPSLEPPSAKDAPPSVRIAMAQGGLASMARLAVWSAGAFAVSWILARCAGGHPGQASLISSLLRSWAGMMAWAGIPVSAFVGMAVAGLNPEGVGGLSWEAKLRTLAVLAWSDAGWALVAVGVSLVLAAPQV